MTKGQALQQFFSGFMTAYPSTSVPDDVVFPYLTYEVSFGTFGDGDQSMTVNLWFYTDSEAIPNAKAKEFSELISRGGTIINCDEGAIWLKRGTPFCQSLSDDVSPNVKRRYINLDVEYLTNN